MGKRRGSSPDISGLSASGVGAGGAPALASGEPAVTATPSASSTSGEGGQGAAMGGSSSPVAIPGKPGAEAAAAAATEEHGHFANWLVNPKKEFRTLKKSSGGSRSRKNQKKGRKQILLGPTKSSSSGPGSTAATSGASGGGGSRAAANDKKKKDDHQEQHSPTLTISGRKSPSPMGRDTPADQEPVNQQQQGQQVQQQVQPRDQRRQQMRSAGSGSSSGGSSAASSAGIVAGGRGSGSRGSDRSYAEAAAVAHDHRRKPSVSGGGAGPANPSGHHHSGPPDAPGDLARAGGARAAAATKDIAYYQALLQQENADEGAPPFSLRELNFLSSNRGAGTGQSAASSSHYQYSKPFDSFSLNPEGGYSALEGTMGDGFWEVGPDKLRRLFAEGPSVAAACSLDDFNISDNAISLDQTSDRRLHTMIVEVKKMCATSPYMQFHAQLLAVYVCAHMGGAQHQSRDNILPIGELAAQEKAHIVEQKQMHRSQGDGNGDRQSRNITVTTAAKGEGDEEEEARRNSWDQDFFKIGDLCYGTSRERALLYKYLADAVGLPCALQRGELPHNDRHWNVVRIGRDDLVVDVMHHPGACYSYKSKMAKQYIELLNSPKSLASYSKPGDQLNNNQDAFRTVQAASFSDQIGRNRFLEPVNWGADLRFVQRVGKGTYGQVYRASLSGFTVAVKMLGTENMSRAERDRVEMEVGLLQMLDHPNIVKYLGRESRSSCIMIFMEYMCHSLYEAVRRAERRERKTFSKSEIVFVMTSICKGLTYLHKLATPVIHRDLKSKNVLVEWKHTQVGDRDEETIFEAKLCDFGVAKELNEDTVANSYVGTCRWMAPEVVRAMTPQSGLSMQRRKAKAYDTKADIWSLGMCLYELLELKVPFHGVDNFEVHGCILRGQSPGISPQTAHNKEFQDLLKLMNTCIHVTPTERPTAKAILTILLLDGF